jgi:hypothetical protein
LPKQNKKSESKEQIEVNREIKIDNRNKKIMIPADDLDGSYRFMSKVRYGPVSGEIFAKNHDRRRELGLPIFLPEI